MTDSRAGASRNAAPTLDVDDRVRVRETSPESLALAHELSDLFDFCSIRIDLGAALLGLKSAELAALALRSPSAQKRRINAFATQQRAELCGLEHGGAPSLPVT